MDYFIRKRLFQPVLKLLVNFSSFRSVSIPSYALPRRLCSRAAYDGQYLFFFPTVRLCDIKQTKLLTMKFKGNVYERTAFTSSAWLCSYKPTTKLLSLLIQLSSCSHTCMIMNKPKCHSDSQSLTFIRYSFILMSMKKKIRIPCSQKGLSLKLDSFQFQQLMEKSSPARLYTVSAKHAASWFSVAPSIGLGFHLEPEEFHIAVKWWLGLDISYGSQCALCPGSCLDP